MNDDVIIPMHRPPTEGTPMLTKAQAIAVTGFTGVMLCDLDDFLVDLNERTGTAGNKTYTRADLHQVMFEDVIKPLYAADCQAILPVDWLKESQREANAERDELHQLAAGERPKLVIAK